jgi:hypothetical protein
LDRGSEWLDGLRAFYLGFLTGLLVVPLCVELGCIIRELRRGYQSTALRRANPFTARDTP